MIPTGNKETESRDHARANWIEGLKKAVPVARNAGIVLTVENFPGKHSAFVTAEDFLQAHREIPQLRLTYDSGNAASGENPSYSFRKTFPYTVHAHFKDWYISDQPKEGYREMLNGKYFKPALIGEGEIEHTKILKEMKEKNYDKYINIEYEGNQDPYEGIRKAVKYLRNIEKNI
jgi:sugar phosphate isomerase/epimerase